MRDIDFGNIAVFFSAIDTLEPDASYDGKNARQDQTRQAIASLRVYFKEYCSTTPSVVKRGVVVESNASSVDEFFN